MSAAFGAGFSVPQPVVNTQMSLLRPLRGPSMLGALLLLGACGDDTPDTGTDAFVAQPDAGTTDAAIAADAMIDAHTPAASQGVTYLFSTNADANEWIVTVVDPTQEPAKVAEFTVDALAQLSGPEGNDAGPSWGDAVSASDGRRVFVNARSVNKVAVFDTETHTLETILDVGERPVHLWNPNHGDEIWVHADGDGAFFVIDQQSLLVSEAIVAAQENTGHGKLLYAAELGERYFATNTNDPGAFALDGHTVSSFIELCGAPCEDDPDTPEDESENTCGGTHDKAYNPRMDFAVFQCTGGNGYAFVNATDRTVVQDLVDISGSIAHSPDNHFIVAFGRSDENNVQIWDTEAPDHNGIDFDHRLTLGGSPSARGTHFRELGETWQAWVPQTAGTAVSIIDFETQSIENVEVGTLTPPEGARHFSRRGALGRAHFYTYSDDAIVAIDLEDHSVQDLGAPRGVMSRMAFVPPVHDHHEH